MAKAKHYLEKVEPTTWCIFWNASVNGDSKPYYASYEYVSKGDSHTVGNWFTTYKEAFEWVFNNVQMY